MRDTKDTKSPKRRRAPMAALASVACAIAVTACGSSGSSDPGSSSNHYAAAVKFSACMRSHGLSSFPDPSPEGGINITPGSGLNPQSPAFQSAQNACSKLLPRGGPGGGPGSESRKLQMLKLARCMRAHGVSSFPDPTNSRPSAPPSGGGIAFGGGGSFLSVPQSLIQSPGFKQAAAACHFPGFGAGGGPKGAAVG